jgi:CubicO group peptidase (beta-lactamase class C family)
MLMMRLTCLALCIAHAHCYAPDLTRLQAIVEEKAALWNTSFSIGVFHKATGAFGVAGGLNNRKTGTIMTTENRFPVGSVTKPWTGTLKAISSNLCVN